MTDLLVAGGLLFTLPLTLLALAVLAAGTWGTIAIHVRREDPTFWRRLLFHLGLFAFILGIFSQGIGLYQAMSVIEAVGNISPALLAGGLKVSMIAPLYGLIIFLVAMVFRLSFDLGARRLAQTHA